MGHSDAIDYKGECYRLYQKYPFGPFLTGIRSAERGDITWRNLFIMINRTIIRGLSNG